MSVRHPVVILISSHHSVGIRSFSPHLEVIPSSQCHSHPHNVIPSSRSHFFVILISSHHSTGIPMSFPSSGSHFDFIPSFHRHPVIFASFRSHPMIPVPLLPSQCQSVIQESFWFHPIIPKESRHFQLILKSSHHPSALPLPPSHSPNVISSSRSHFDFIPSFHRHPNVIPSSRSHFGFIPSFHRHPIIFRSFEHHPVGPSRAAVPKSLGIVCIQPLGQPRLHPWDRMTFSSFWGHSRSGCNSNDWTGAAMTGMAVPPSLPNFVWNDRTGPKSAQIVILPSFCHSRPRTLGTKYCTFLLGKGAIKKNINDGFCFSHTY